jgi:MFS-type transporter involved in bile tolerance (Atg22 family)
MNTAGTYVRRSIGAVLVLLVLFPVYRILSVPDAGAFQRGAIALADLSRSMLAFGTIIVVAVGVILSRVVDRRAVERAFGRVGRWLESVSHLRLAVILAVVSALITLAFAVFVLEGKPNLIDGIVQLLHAR